MESASQQYKPTGISIVIPNYNGVNLFEHTLGPLLEASENTHLSYEIIIVDDCSTDESIQYLEQNHPSIILLKNAVNSGFSATINKGIFIAKYDLVLLLNSDVILTPNYFERQLRYFNDPTTFGVMGRIVGWDDDLIQDTARFPMFHLLKIKTSCNYFLADENENKHVYTLYLSGANALVKKDKLIALGGFNTLFTPFYIEDCDLSIRAWRLGWKCIYEHQSICRHKTSTSVKAKNSNAAVELIYNRNKIFLHAVHLNSFLFIFYFIQIFIEACFRLLMFRVVLMKALWGFVLHRKECFNARRSFGEMQKKHHMKTSLFDVSQLIQRNVKGLRIIRFSAGKNPKLS